MFRNYIFCLFCFITGCLQAPPESAPDGGHKVETYLNGGVLTDNLKFQNKILIPTDDDQALAETVRSGFRVISDRSKYLQNVLAQYRPRVTANCYNGTDISLTATPILIYDPTTDPNNPVWLQFKIATPTVLTPAGLSAHSHYYVYAINNAGNVDFQVTLNPPDAQLLNKGGDTAFRFLFHFRTNTSDALITNFTLENNRMLYMSNLVDISPGVGTADTIDVALYVPPHAKKALIESHLSNIDPAAGIYILFRPFGFGFNENTQHSGPANAGPIANVATAFVEQSLLSQKFDVSINGATLARWGASVAGYTDF